MSRRTLETCPEVGASRVSKLLFLWTDGFTKKSEAKELTDNGLWDINPREKCNTVCPEFRKHLVQQHSNINSYSSSFSIDKSHTNPSQEDGLRRRKGNKDDNYRNDAIHEKEDEERPHSDGLQSDSRKYCSLWFVIFRTFWKEFLYSQGCRLLQFSMFWLTNPHFMSYLMDHNADPGSSTWYGVVLSVTLLLLLVTGSLAVEHCFFSKQNLEIHLESALMTTVYRKAMNLHNRARKTYSIGELTNYMLSDCDNIACHLTQINYLLLTPVHFIVVFYQLYQILGPASLLGLLFIILITPMNVCAAIKMRSLYEENARNRDERMKLLNEVLVGIKVLKLNAWETCFGEKLKEARQKEIEVIRRNLNYRAFTVFSWNASPYVVSVVMFCGYFLINEDSILTAKSAFAVVSLLNLLRYAINDTPELLFHFMKTSVAVNRLQNFLRAEEYNKPSENQSAGTDSAIYIRDGEYSWDPDATPTLKSICIDIPEGKLVSIVGQVGSGKSSIISAILGEIQKVRGYMNVRGSIAYVSQQAWIQNDTLQNNILFGKDLDRKLYRKVIEACALQPDLDLLPAGDQTEIGERGINLSGGQKQRVSLARAVYNDADIYLLDDPLSAVDSHVGKHIFDQVIGDSGILRDKTRVLVTHSISYLPQVDSIIVVDEGRIEETGTFLELLNSDGTFTNVIRSFFTDYEENRECLMDNGPDMVLDDVIKAKLERLDSDKMDSTHDQMKRLISREANGQVSRQLSTPETDQGPDGRCVQEEEDMVDTSKLQKWNLFKEYTKSFGIGHMVWVCLVYALYYILWAGANIWLVQWTEDPVFHNVSDGSRKEVWWTNMKYLGIYAGLGLAMSLCILIYAIVVTWGIVQASQDLYNRLLMSILKSPMEFFDTTPVGRITSRFSSDMDTIDDSLPENLEYWLDCAMNISVAMFAVIYSTPTMLAVIIPLASYYYALQVKHTQRSCFLRNLSSKTRSPIESRFTESVTGAETVRAYRAQDRFRETVESKIDNYHRMYFYQLLNHRWLGVHMLAMGNLVCASSALIRSVVRGAQSPGLLGLGTAFTVEINGCMNWFVILQSIVENQLTSVERILKYINTPDEASWRESHHTLPNSWPQRGQIEFRNYSLGYRQHLDLVLTNISFTVQSGEKIGVVGRTGAGKSSLVLSLFRLVESAGGAILIDGVDIQNIGLHDLREGLAIIPQDPVLFTGTLRMNLDPEDRYTDQEIWTAIEHTNLKPFVESLPGKLETECGEGGSNFSLGQRQLFCLARTLLRKSKILVLDEATAAVDMETDDLIQQTIRSEFKDCTVLTIAHRLNTVMDYDRILVLDNGKVVEFDSPETLVKQMGFFYQMTVDAGITNSRMVSS